MIQTVDIKEINKIAEDIIDKVSQASNSNATVLAFYGDLGVGKTTITKEIARQLGIKENVVSPTFVIMKIYKINNKKFKNLIHIDAYRLDGSKDLLNLGWKEIIKNKDNLIIVEWPERIIESLPSNVYNINLEHKDETTRTVKFWYN